MDLFTYYDKIRREEAQIVEEFPVIVSLNTGDGGRAGHLTETPKKVAAQMIVQGQGRLASSEEAEAFRAIQTNALRKLKEAEDAASMRMSLVPTEHLEHL